MGQREMFDCAADEGRGGAAPFEWWFSPYRRVRVGVDRVRVVEMSEGRFVVTSDTPAHQSVRRRIYEGTNGQNPGVLAGHDGDASAFCRCVPASAETMRVYPGLGDPKVNLRERRQLAVRVDVFLAFLRRPGCDYREWAERFEAALRAADGPSPARPEPAPPAPTRRKAVRPDAVGMGRPILAGVAAQRFEHAGVALDAAVDAGGQVWVRMNRALGRALGCAARDAFSLVCELRGTVTPGDLADVEVALPAAFARPGRHKIRCCRLEALEPTARGRDAASLLLRRIGKWGARAHALRVVAASPAEAPRPLAGPPPAPEPVDSVDTFSSLAHPAYSYDFSWR